MYLVKDQPSKHWALDYGNEEPTPWLLPPKSKLNNVIFDPSFIEWHGQRWMTKFKKQDIHEAKGDFRASLLNNPDRIPIRWEEYEGAMKHYAGTVLTQAANDPIGVREHDKQHIMRYQSALMADTIEELPPDTAIAPHVEQALLNHQTPSKLLKFQRHLLVQAAIDRGEIKLIRHYYRGAFLNGVQCLSDNQWWNTEDDWISQSND
ncbi:MAG: hypothetical protein AAGA60_10860 [Cyanobacteria bacterium P01_E01_bin.42]